MYSALLVLCFLCECLFLTANLKLLNMCRNCITLIIRFYTIVRFNCRNYIPVLVLILVYQSSQILMFLDYADNLVIRPYNLQNYCSKFLTLSQQIHDLKVKCCNTVFYNFYFTWIKL